MTIKRGDPRGKSYNSNCVEDRGKRTGETLMMRVDTGIKMHQKKKKKMHELFRPSLHPPPPNHLLVSLDIEVVC